MLQSYTIGVSRPWRLTKESGLRLLKALAVSEAELVYIHEDTTCPPGYYRVRVEMDSSKAAAFRDMMQCQVRVGERIGGSACE